MFKFRKRAQPDDPAAKFRDAIADACQRAEDASAHLPLFVRRALFADVVRALEDRASIMRVRHAVRAA